MPAVDYDYNYYSNARKVNRTANAKGATNKVVSSVATTSNRKTNTRVNGSSYTTRQTTKEQVRRAMYDTPNAKANTSSKIPVKKNNILDIPEINHGKKVSNNATVKSPRNNTRNNTRNNKSVSKSSRQSSTKSQTNRNNTKPAEMKLKKPELSAYQKKKAMEKAVSRVKSVLYLACGFAIAFLVCYRYSLINERFNQLEKIKKELITAQTVNEQIQAEIDSQTDLSYIENYAKYQLGMQKPSNSQIVYVNVEKQDRIITPVSIEEVKEKTWFDNLYEKVIKLFE